MEADQPEAEPPKTDLDAVAAEAYKRWLDAKEDGGPEEVEDAWVSYVFTRGLAQDAAEQGNEGN